MTSSETTGVPDETKLTDAVEAAEAEINSGLSTRYLTPVDVSLDTSLAALLKRKTLDLAEYYLVGRGDQVSEHRKNLADAVLEWVGLIAGGERHLVGASTPASTESREPLVKWSDSSRTLLSTSGRVFSRSATRNL